MKNEENLNKAIEYYKNNNFSVFHVSKLFGVARVTLIKALKTKGIEIRDAEITERIDKVLLNVTKENIDLIHRDYGVSKEILKQAMILNKTELKKLQIELAINEYTSLSRFDRSIASISTKYGINKKTLTRHLKDAGIPIDSSNGIFVDEHIFDVIDTEEKAYWLGFLYADGYIESKSNGVGLNLSLKDKEHVEKYTKFLKYDGKLSISVSHLFNSKDIHNKNGEVIYMISTVIHNDCLWKALNEKGCVPNKSLILKFPDEEIFNNDKSLILAFIRGYFDGDGTLGLYKHSKTNPKLEESLIFVGTLPFLQGVEKYLGKGFIMQKKNCNSATYRLSYSTAKANKAAELMYSNATIYLDRKYDIYINKYATRNRVKTVNPEMGIPC